MKIKKIGVGLLVAGMLTTGTSLSLAADNSNLKATLITLPATDMVQATESMYVEVMDIVELDTANNETDDSSQQSQSVMALKTIEATEALKVVPAEKIELTKINIEE